MKRLQFDTGWGWVTLSYCERGIYEVSLPQEQKEKGLPLFDGSCPIKEDFVLEAIELLRRYFAGEVVSFEGLKLDFFDRGNFAKKVYKSLALVPYGQTTFYQELASQARNPRAARAVGSLMRSNKLPVILPCHRVLAKDGTLGGFSSGLDWKRKLLEWESYNLKKRRKNDPASGS